MLEFLSWNEETTSFYACFVQPKREVQKSEGTENSTGKNNKMHEVRHLYIILSTIVSGPTRTVLYVCCRDGKKKGHTGPSKTGKTRKHKPTRKIEKYCIARMIATECFKDGKVQVRYISTHTDHDLGLQKCKHLPLPPSTKAEIEQQFAQAIPIERIIDSK